MARHRIAIYEHEFNSHSGNLEPQLKCQKDGVLIQQKEIKMNDLSILTQTIQVHFNKQELIQVLDGCGVNYEHIVSEYATIGALIRESVKYFNRRSHVAVLAKALAKAKPNVDFSHWGAPVPIDSLHGILRQLLTKAFSFSELKTLAFDLFSDLTGEMTSGKSHAVELIVDTAIANDAIHRLMEWIRKENPAKYSKYVHRVDRALLAHQNKPDEYVPEVPKVKPRKPQADFSSIFVFTLQQYANGLSDEGKMAKEALKTAGIDE